jgi:hypothetical protein
VESGFYLDYIKDPLGAEDAARPWVPDLTLQKEKEVPCMIETAQFKLGNVKRAFFTNHGLNPSGDQRPLGEVFQRVVAPKCGWLFAK